MIFNVIETGSISLLGQERPYNIVHFQVDSPQTIFLLRYCTRHPQKEQLYPKSNDRLRRRL